MAQGRLRQDMKSGVSARVRGLKAQIFARNPKICIERALYVTRSYRKNDHLPAVIKRAHGLDFTSAEDIFYVIGTYIFR